MHHENMSGLECGSPSVGAVLYQLSLRFVVEPPCFGPIGLYGITSRSRKGA